MAVGLYQRVLQRLTNDPGVVSYGQDDADLRFVGRTRSYADTRLTSGSRTKGREITAGDDLVRVTFQREHLGFLPQALADRFRSDHYFQRSRQAGHITLGNDHARSTQHLGDCTRRRPDASDARHHGLRPREPELSLPRAVPI